MKKLLFSSLFLACCFESFGETWIYRERTGQKVIIQHIVKQAVPPGQVITSTVGEGEDAEIQSFTLDEYCSTISWEFNRPREKTRILAVREKNNIILSGFHDGNAISKKFDAGTLPWNQAFQLGLETFVAAGGKSLKFWAIGTSSPGDMKIAKFSAEVKKTESVTVDGKSVDACHVRVSLAGLWSAFWHGDYWFRKADGIFILYKGKNGPGAPVSVTELVEEKPLSDDGARKPAKEEQEERSDADAEIHL